MAEPIYINKQKNICTITFNRPKKLNAINSEIYKRLPLLLNEAAQDDDISIVVITGTGRYFTSGNDFYESPSGEDSRFHGNQQFRDFIAALIDFPKCLVAAVNGPSIGVGFTMLGLCDYVFMSDSAWLMCPFERLALMPEGCSTVTFPQIFGPMLSKEILLENRRVTSEEAHRFGLANELFPEAEFSTRLSERVAQLAKIPPQFLRQTKQVLRSAQRDQLHSANIRECQALYARLDSPEVLQALTAAFKPKPSAKL